MNPGGAEKSLLDILKHMDYSKYHVELLLLEELGVGFKGTFETVDVFVDLGVGFQC